MANGQKYTIKNRIWICTKEGTYLGQGRISLLEQIEEHGSISKAAKAMNMSYKKAWKLVDSMNKLGKNPLVIRSIGGAGGGGSVLSEEGKQAILQFQEIIASSRAHLDVQMKELNLV